jgi:hypothetical protein
MKEYLTIILTIASIIVPVFATIYTGYIRIKNENKESHKPYLILGEIEKIYNVNRFVYFLAIIGEKFKKKSNATEIEELSKEESNINISLALKNIGYGVASNIKFYDLNTASQIIGLQESSKTINQKKFTTFDIPKDNEKKVQTCLITEKENDVVMEESHCILCIYQDLNENIYDFIIGIDIKKGGAYDFFAFQKSSHSYKRLIKGKKKEYNKILNDYIK